MARSFRVKKSQGWHERGSVVEEGLGSQIFILMPLSLRWNPCPWGQQFILVNCAVSAARKGRLESWSWRFLGDLELLT